MIKRIIKKSIKIGEKMRIAVYQMRSKIGNFDWNRDQLIKACFDAHTEGASLLVAPDLCLGGYPALDLWRRKDFLEKEKESIRYIKENLPQSFAVIFGSLHIEKGGAVRTSLLMLTADGVMYQRDKYVFPTKDQGCYESQYFSRGIEGVNVCAAFNLKIGIVSYYECSDTAVRQKLCADKIDLLIIVGACSYFQGSERVRDKLFTEDCIKNFPVIFVNSVGVFRGLIFEGRSGFWLSNGSRIIADHGQEQIIYADPFSETSTQHLSLLSEEELLLSSLVYGIREYARTNGFLRVHLGLSGGIDSALVMILAVKALGSDNVVGILLPGHYSSEGSVIDAKKLADNLGSKTLEISIADMHDFTGSLLGKHFCIEGIVDQNLQARLRGLCLMAYSNSEQSLLLTTGNKSELAVGFGTLYGDLCGGLNPIGDLWKTQIYTLAYYINKVAGSNLIPIEILEKEPSAELRANQKDSDDLPCYKNLDGILSSYLELGFSKKDLISSGYSLNEIELVLKRFFANEFKRSQHAPILKVSQMYFGLGYLWPYMENLKY